VTIGIVEALEEVHISHRQHVLPPQALQSLVQSATPRQAGQLVTKGHEISLMCDCRHQHQQHMAAQNVEGGIAAERLRQHQQNAEQRDDLRRMGGSRLAKVLDDQQHQRHEEHRIRQLDEREPVGLERGPANHHQPGM